MALKFAQWMDQGGVVDVSSKEAAIKSHSLVWHVIDEITTSTDYKVVKERLTKAARLLDAMPEDERNGRFEQSDTNWLVALQKMKEIIGRTYRQSKLWNSTVNGLMSEVRMLKYDWTKSPPPKLAMELKTAMEDTLDIVQANCRSIKRLDKMLHSLFGPLGG